MQEGMTGYYRRFVHHYAKKAAPLFTLTGSISTVARIHPLSGWMHVRRHIPTVVCRSLYSQMHSVMAQGRFCEHLLVMTYHYTRYV